MGLFTSGAFVGVVFVLFLSAIRFSFNIFARSLFSCLVFLSFFEFIFLSLFWSPSELGAGWKNSCPPSVFSMGVAFRVGMIPGVLLRVTLECTLGAVLMLSFVVGVDDVCTLCSFLWSLFFSHSFGHPLNLVLGGNIPVRLLCFLWVFRSAWG